MKPVRHRSVLVTSPTIISGGRLDGHTLNEVGERVEGRRIYLEEVWPMDNTDDEVETATMDIHSKFVKGLE